MEKKKYKVIVKVEQEKFVKYHVGDLLSFTKFIDKSFPKWRYFNVFDGSGTQVGSFTKQNPPKTRTL